MWRRRRRQARRIRQIQVRRGPEFSRWCSRPRRGRTGATGPGDDGRASPPAGKLRSGVVAPPGWSAASGRVRSASRGRIPPKYRDRGLSVSISARSGENALTFGENPSPQENAGIARRIGYCAHGDLWRRARSLGRSGDRPANGPVRPRGVWRIFAAIRMVRGRQKGGAGGPRRALPISDRLRIASRSRCAGASRASVPGPRRHFAGPAGARFARALRQAAARRRACAPRHREGTRLRA